MKTKLKKLLPLLLAVTLACVAFTAAGCNKKQSPAPAAVDDGRLGLTLSDYTVELTVGGTHRLVPQLIGESGNAVSGGEFSYSAENTAVATVASDGTITAVGEGETSVDVQSGKLRRSCYVTVVGETAAGVKASIFAPEIVYVGTTATVTAGLIEQGGLKTVAQNVTFTIAESNVCMVAGGVLSPVGEGEFTLKASFTADGASYSAEKVMRVERLKSYEASCSFAGLALDETVSGEANDKCRSKAITITARDVLDPDMDRALTVDEYTVTPSMDGIVDIAQSGTETTITAAKEGEAALRFSIGNTSSLVLTVSVSTPVATVGDMDVLAMASMNAPDLLAGRYMLVSDIDFNGGIILPIAAENYDTQFGKLNTQYGSNVTGQIYRYVLTEDEGSASGLTLLPRADFLKENTAMTEDDFREKVVKKWYPNADNLRFSGVFDGNGYAIKNAAIPIAYNKPVDNRTNALSAHESVFGTFVGTLKNIGFENLHMFDPETISADQSEAAQDLVKGYKLTAGRADFEFADLAASGGKTVFYTASVVGRTLGSPKFENVYVEFDYNMPIQSGIHTGVLIAWPGAVDVSNCVIEVTSGVNSGLVYGLGGMGQGSAGAGYRNNIMVGVPDYIEKHSGGDDTVGYRGNWFTAGTCSELFGITPNFANPDVRTLGDVLATFDTSVWDMRGFTGGGSSLPRLKNNCSL